MIAISIDSYNQAISTEVCHTLKSVQGGDDIPRVLIILDDKGGKMDLDKLAPNAEHVPAWVDKNNNLVVVTTAILKYPINGVIVIDPAGIGMMFHRQKDGDT